jgi:hypothetical protein
MKKAGWTFRPFYGPQRMVPWESSLLSQSVVNNSMDELGLFPRM